MPKCARRRVPWRIATWALVLIFVGFNMLLVPGSVHAPSRQDSLTGRIVGQPADFAHEFLRRRTTARGQRADDGMNESAAVVVVGGGVAGLVAAWSLRRSGVNVVLLEMEDDVGGNARSGADGPGGARYPWGAHYVPIPSRRARVVRSFFEDLGLLKRRERELAEHATMIGKRSSRLLDGDDDVEDEAALHTDVVRGVPTCQRPTERLFYGRQLGWRDGEQGVLPLEDMSDADRAAMQRFSRLVSSEARRQTRDGRAPFTLPLSDCSSDERARQLDAQSFGAWLDEHGLAGSAPLRWYLEYGTRDDYGTSLNATSAWAGLHYYASRASEERFEWADGNGHLVQLLVQAIQAVGGGAGDDASGVPRGSGTPRMNGALRTNALVYSIEQQPSGAVAGGARPGVRVRYVQRVSGGGGVSRRGASGEGARAEAGASAEGAGRGARAGDVRFGVIDAQRVIYAAPLFTAAHVIAGWRPEWLSAFTYAPWLVANLHLDAPPDGQARCDNVLYRARGLGYTLSRGAYPGGVPGAMTGAAATALGLSRGPGAVLTYYRALADEVPSDARRRMLGTPWAQWRDDVLDELSAAHPGLRGATHRLDVRLIGHAMARPTPGLVWGAARFAAAASKPLGGAVHFAHSDLSALPLFEEAVYWGTRAAAEVHAYVKR